MYSELLWTFIQLPDDYIIVDTETTGLPDEKGFPDIVTLGITVVRNRKITESIEFEIRPQRRISDEAQAIHGITNEQAQKFESFECQWNQVSSYLANQLIVIHNASFDWPIVINQVARHRLRMPSIKGVFCSQKAAFPWAKAMNFPCSSRGPSLDTLTKELGVEDLRIQADGIHGAKIDSQQTALVVEKIRHYGDRGS